MTNIYDYCAMCGDRFDLEDLRAVFSKNLCPSCRRVYRNMEGEQLKYWKNRLGGNSNE